MGGRLTADGARHALGPVMLENNTWGRGELVNGLDYVQSIVFGDRLADGVRFDWAWPPAPMGVRAYPELFAGRKPWGAERAGEDLPMTVAEAAKGLRLAVDLDWGGQEGGFNVALDLWVAESPRAGPEGLRQEIMVWLKPGHARPAGAPQGRAEAGDVSGPLWVRDGHGGGQDGGAGWTYIALVSDRPLSRGEIDLGALLAGLAARGELDPGHWLLSVELGAEVVAGAGWLEVRAFSLTREGAPRAEVGIVAPSGAASDAAVLPASMPAGADGF